MLVVAGGSGQDLMCSVRPEIEASPEMVDTSHLCTLPHAAAVLLLFWRYLDRLCLQLQTVNGSCRCNLGPGFDGVSHQHLVYNSQS